MIPFPDNYNLFRTVVMKNINAGNFQAISILDLKCLYDSIITLQESVGVIGNATVTSFLSGIYKNTILIGFNLFRDGTACHCFCYNISTHKHRDILIDVTGIKLDSLTTEFLVDKVKTRILKII